MTTLNLFTVLVASALLALLGIAGCGGEGSTGSVKAPPTKHKFILEADAICEKVGYEQLEGGVAYLKEHPNATEEAMVEPVLLPPLATEVQKLRSLTPPKGDETEVLAFIEELKKNLERAKEEPQHVATEKKNVFDPASKLAKSYGFADCSVLP